MLGCESQCRAQDLESGEQGPHKCALHHVCDCARGKPAHRAQNWDLSDSVDARLERNDKQTKGGVPFVSLLILPNSPLEVKLPSHTMIL